MSRQAGLEARLAEVEGRLAGQPDRILDLEARGRLLRELGREGWAQDLARAADLQDAPAAPLGRQLQVAYLRWVAGADVPGGDDGAALRALVERTLPLLDAERPHPVSGPGTLVAAFLVGRDDVAAELGTRLTDKAMGPAVVLVRDTAVARRAGDADALAACRERWQRRAKAEPVDSTAVVPAARDVLRLLGG